ncbi:MAG: acyl-CoA thioesterase [Novosphingobium sp.]|nr:acyl-CoA thioesterase [Novosphingobium sp.]
MSTAIPYSYPIGVEPGDIDFMGHVNNAHYLTWVQDAVVAHWRNLAPPEAVARLLWVALKHEITYRRPTFLGDDVIATVLLEKVEGARAFYETVIRRGEEVLAEVKSSWCCVDIATMRPARLAKDIVARFFAEGE